MVCEVLVGGCGASMPTTRLTLAAEFSGKTFEVIAAMAVAGIRFIRFDKTSESRCVKQLRHEPCCSSLG